MSISKQRLAFLKFICKVVNINPPIKSMDVAAFCITFHSKPEELQDFNNSTEYSVPVPWLDVLFPKMTSEQFEEYDRLTAAICSPLKEPVFYRGIGGHATASRPAYEGTHNESNQRAPYERKISPIETISNQVLETVGKPPKLQEFPTQERLGSLVQMAVNLSEKDGTVNRYLFKKVLNNMIPNAYTIRTSPLKTTLINKENSTKSEFPFEERVRFI